jgi:hydrogenase maturation protein HypF
MAEHGILNEQPVIGISFDGTGYGEDGTIWGGEILIADYTSYKRPFHLAYVPLPGGDAAVRRPARAGLAHLWQAGLDWYPELPCVSALCVEERQALRNQLEHHLNTPLTSSMGRLFDAASAIAGVRQKVNYEAQAAIEFEALVDPEESGAYPFEFRPGASLIDPAPMWETLVADVLAGQPTSKISARFHNGIAHMVRDVCLSVRQSTGIAQVVLSGGVWQNFTLLKKVIPLLQNSGFRLHIHRLVPPNDGGLSLGQALIAYHRLTAGIK